MFNGLKRLSIGGKRKSLDGQTLSNEKGSNEQLSQTDVKSNSVKSLIKNFEGKETNPLANISSSPPKSNTASLTSVTVTSNFVKSESSPNKTKLPSSDGNRAITTPVKAKGSINESPLKVTSTSKLAAPKVYSSQKKKSLPSSFESPVLNNENKNCNSGSKEVCAIKASPKPSLSYLNPTTSSASKRSTSPLKRSSISFEHSNQTSTRLSPSPRKQQRSTTNKRSSSFGSTPTKAQTTIFLTSSNTPISTSSIKSTGMVSQPSSGKKVSPQKSIHAITQGKDDVVEKPLQRGGNGVNLPIEKTVSIQGVEETIVASSDVEIEEKTISQALNREEQKIKVESNLSRDDNNNIMSELNLSLSNMGIFSEDENVEKKQDEDLNVSNLTISDSIESRSLKKMEVESMTINKSDETVEGEKEPMHETQKIEKNEKTDQKSDVKEKMISKPKRRISYGLSMFSTGGGSSTNSGTKNGDSSMYGVNGDNYPKYSERELSNKLQQKEREIREIVSSEMNKKLASKDEEITQLTGDCNDYQQKLSDKETEMQEIMTSIEEMEGIMLEKMKEFESINLFETKIEQLKMDLQNRESYIEDMLLKLNQSKEENNQIQEKMEDFEKKHHQSMAKKDEEINNLKEEHLKTCNAYERRMEEKEKLKDEEVQEVKKNLSKAAQDQLNNAKQIYLDLQEKHNILEEEMENLKATYDVTNKNLIQLTTKYGQLESEFMNKTNALSLLEKANMEAKLEMEKDKKSLEALSEENSKRAANANYLYAEIADIKKSYALLMDEKEALSKTNKELEDATQKLCDMYDAKCKELESCKGTSSTSASSITDNLLLQSSINNE